jgi:hypothetical protein
VSKELKAVIYHLIPITAAIIRTERASVREDVEKREAVTQLLGK